MTIEQLNRDMGRIEGDVRAMDRRVQDMQMKVDEVHRAITDLRTISPKIGARNNIRSITIWTFSERCQDNNSA